MFHRADLKRAQPKAGRGHSVDAREERGPAAKGLLGRVVNDATIEYTGCLGGRHGKF